MNATRNQIDEQAIQAWGEATRARLDAAEREFARFALLDVAALICSQFPDARYVDFMRDEGTYYVFGAVDEAGNDVTDEDPSYDNGGSVCITYAVDEEWRPFEVEFDRDPFGDVDLRIDAQKVLAAITPVA